MAVTIYLVDLTYGRMHWLAKTDMQAYKLVKRVLTSWPNVK